MELTYKPIGVVHSPFKKPDHMPLQPTGDASASGTVEVFHEFTEGLKDIDGFSHLILIYHFHRVAGVELLPKPFLDSRQHGIFATRAPVRPNPIGMSVVRLAGVRGRELEISNLDVIDGTPVLDIKPYVPQFDAVEDCQIGWLESSIGRSGAAEADDRFT